MTSLPCFAPCMPARARNRWHNARTAKQQAIWPVVRRGRMCATAVPSTGSDIEKLFSRLTHKNQTLRHAASSALASMADAAIIARLVDLLSISDTAHRRAAVQALGMTGLSGISAVTETLCATSDVTVRASCAKALAATALFHPNLRAEFPSEAVAALRNAIVDADPVTKIAAVGCLGTLGCDATDRDGARLAGNDTCFRILGELLGKGLDVAIGAVAVGAVAQIGQNGTAERRVEVIEKLKMLAGEGGEDDDESGFGYIKEMARNHVEQLEGGPKIPE